MCFRIDCDTDSLIRTGHFEQLLQELFAEINWPVCTRSVQVPPMVSQSQLAGAAINRKYCTQKTAENPKMKLIFKPLHICYFTADVISTKFSSQNLP